MKKSITALLLLSVAISHPLMAASGYDEDNRVAGDDGMKRQISEAYAGTNAAASRQISRQKTVYNVAGDLNQITKVAGSLYQTENAGIKIINEVKNKDGEVKINIVADQDGDQTTRYTSR